MKHAFLFTANAHQAVQADLMISSLRDRNKGNFSGDIWVLSTGLNETVKRYLDDINIRYIENSLPWAYEAMDWQAIVQIPPSSERRKSFDLYRDKRMSKLIYLDWFERHGHEYSVVAVADNDLYFQKDINDIFKIGKNGKINIGEEDDPILPGTEIWYKDFHYKRVTGEWDYNCGNRECNIGFIISDPESMNIMLESAKKLFQSIPSQIIRDFDWNDQDIFRLLRSKRPDDFQRFDTSVILHLCGGGMSRVRAVRSDIFVDGMTGDMPTIVHFGGGTWAKFPNIARSFQVPQAHFLFRYESEDAQVEAINGLWKSSEMKSELRAY